MLTSNSPANRIYSACTTI